MLVSPLNEIDAYTLSKIGVLNFTGIIPSDSGILLSDAVRLFDSAAENDESLLQGFSEINLKVIHAIANLPRFSSLFVSDYMRTIDEKEDRQFSALTIVLPDGTRFVTFRGTDDYLVSWKEDLMLAVQDTIPSHADALFYLQKQCMKSFSPIIVSGHSKGGNLAVHAAMMLPSEYQDQILSVFNFDGPGFRYDLNTLDEFQRIKAKVRKYVSQQSIVGRLLISESIPTIVHTDETGWRAHNGFNWDIDTICFTPDKEFSSTSNALQAGFNNSVEAIPEDRRKDFLDEFFNTLYENDVHTLTELNRKKLQELSSQAPEVYRSAEVKALISTLSKGYLQETVANMVSSLPSAPKPKLQRAKRSRLHRKNKAKLDEGDSEHNISEVNEDVTHVENASENDLQNS